MVHAHQNPSGYLTLLAILIVASLAASTVITLALFATDDTLIANGVGAQYQTMAAADGCAEVALANIAIDANFTASDTAIQLDEISSDCVYSIEAITTENGEEQKIIRSTGTFVPNNSKARLQITVGTGPSDIYPTPTIISWQRVADF